MINISKKSTGFTLIELMVSLLLTSLFLGGVFQIFDRTSRNFKTQRTLSYMMEDARFALDKMNSEFRRAGFLANKQLASGTNSVIFHAGIELDFSYDASTNVGSYTLRNTGGAGSLLSMGVNEIVGGAVNTSGPVSDSVVIRYQLNSGADLADNQLSPCTRDLALGAGETNTDRHIVFILFYMAFDPDIDSNVLYCKSFRENLDDTVAPNFQAPAAIGLVSNVERFRVLYGVSVPSGSNGAVYLSQDQVATDWVNVQSIRLSVVLHSEESNISIDVPGNYTINGKLSIAPIDAADKRLYRVFSTTVAFR